MIDLIKSQVLTTKTNLLLQNNIFVFDVDKKASKLEIKAVIQKVFNVKVISINSYILPGQSRRLGKFFGFKNSYKRVFVKIAKGEKIPFFSAL
uniref:Large ribosomal subunit protein uL23c n=1 Tax=Euglena mutabilis TaxID=38275 RepID=A0A1B0UL11_EUGMU|nr:ribosomal protein L23 [Euglena mutabilis]